MKVYLIYNVADNKFVGKPYTRLPNAMAGLNNNRKWNPGTRFVLIEYNLTAISGQVLDR